MLPDRVTCFSLHQPYAGLVAAGLKTIETRLQRWPVKARTFPSTLLICSTRAADDDAFIRVWRRVHPEEHAKGIERRAWLLANVRRVRPFHVSGLQGFARTVPRESVERALDAHGVAK